MQSGNTVATDRDATLVRAKAIMAEAPVLTLAAGQGDDRSAETIYYAYDENGIYCAVRDDGSTLASIRRDPRITFAVERGPTGPFLRGTGRAVILSGIEDEPEVKALLERRGERVAQYLASFPGCTAVKIIPDALQVSEHSEGHAPRTTVAYPFGQEPKGNAALWWQAVRPFAYTASVTPMLLGAVLAWFLPADGTKVAWWLLPGILVAGVLFHTGANLVSDYYDFMRGVDRKGTMGGSGILVNGLIPPRHIFWGGVLSFGIGTLIGLAMVSVRGWPLLVLGMVGFLGGFFYCGWPIQFKYRGFGELGIFALFGPLMVIGSYYVLTGSFQWDVLLISLPVGFLVAAIVQANNLRDIADDRTSRITTVSNTFGQSFAAIEYYAMVSAAYASVVVMVALGTLPVWTLVVGLSIPPALKVVRQIVSAGGRHTSHLAIIDQMTAQVHLLFGVLLMVGIAIGKLLS